MKKINFLIVSLLFLNGLWAQTGSSTFYQAYLNNDLSAWEEGIAELERAQEQAPSPVTLLAIAKAEYGAIGSCFAIQDMEAAAEYAKRAQKHTLEVLDEQPEHAEAKALLAGIYGMRIALKPMKGMTLGPKSGRLLSEAVSVDPDCALAYYHRGTSAYNTPETWGGSMEQAAREFQLARQKYEARGQVEQNWEYLSTLAWLGQAHYELGQFEQAVAVYEHALSVEPAFGWVQYQLLPEAQKALVGE